MGYGRACSLRVGCRACAAWTTEMRAPALAREMRAPTPARFPVGRWTSTCDAPRDELKQPMKNERTSRASWGVEIRMSRPYLPGYRSNATSIEQKVERRLQHPVLLTTLEPDENRVAVDREMPGELVAAAGGEAGPGLGAPAGDERRRRAEAARTADERRRR